MAILIKRAVHIPELREVKPRSTRKNVIKLYIFGNKNKITDKKKPMKKTLLSKKKNRNLETHKKTLLSLKKTIGLFLSVWPFLGTFISILITKN